MSPRVGAAGFLLPIAMLASCSVALDFHECDTDDDCAARAGGQEPFCTEDHFCVEATPESRLCGGGLFGSTDPGVATIAGLFRLSGASGDKDTEIAQGAELLLDQLVEQHLPLRMVVCDVAGGQAERSLEKAIRDYHIVGAVGPTTSGDMLRVAPIAVAADVLLISPSATSPQLTGLADGGLVWRTAASDNFQAKTLAQLIPLMLAASRPPVVDVTAVHSSYGTGLSDAFVAEWTARSGSGPKATHQFESPAVVEDVLTQLANDQPDYSLIIADEDAAALAAGLYAQPAGLSATQFLFTDGAKGSSLLNGPPPPAVAARIRGTGPAAPQGTIFEIFQLKYVEKYGTDPAKTSYVVNSYDAAFALALAVLSQPDPPHATGHALADALRRMSTPGVTVGVQSNDFNTGTNTLSTGGAIDLEGTSGPLTWDPNTGDLSDAPIEVWGINANVSPPTFCTILPQPKNAADQCP